MTEGEHPDQVSLLTEVVRLKATMEVELRSVRKLEARFDKLESRVTTVLLTTLGSALLLILNIVGAKLGLL